MDDQGYQDWPLTAGNIANGYTVGEYGDYRYRGSYPRSIMPDIEDIFVRDGITLTHVYGSSICAPSRRTMLTGRDFQQVGVHNNDCPSVPLNMPILPAELDKAGYRTGFYGKWHMGFTQEEALPGNKGIEEARIYVHGNIDHKTGRSGVGKNCHLDSLSWIFDHTSTTGYSDIYSGSNSGYNYFMNASNRPSPRCNTCSEGDSHWGVSDQIQHYGSYIRDVAISRIKTHDPDGGRPLALFLMWSGPH
eukprot:1496281-Prymnesium_polylepis.1